MEGRTVIVIAHRLSTAERADRVAVLEGGRLVEIASHDELLERNAHYARLWASWQAGLGDGEESEEGERPERAEPAPDAEGGHAKRPPEPPPGEL